MRFLIGIIIGTALTLLLATALDTSARTALGTSADMLFYAWHSLVEKTSTTLFSPTAGEPSEVEAAQPSAEPQTIGEPGAMRLAERPAPALIRATEPAIALAPPAELPPPPPAEPTAPQPAARPVSDDADQLPTPTGEVTVAALPEEIAKRIGEDRTADGATGVWTPFHSRMSAEGFAARLSRALDHDFRVERRAAGAYQVVFDVSSADQRETLLSGIAEITGQ